MYLNELFPYLYFINIRSEKDVFFVREKIILHVLAITSLEENRSSIEHCHVS